jgi:hypothetical protein
VLGCSSCVVFGHVDQKWKSARQCCAADPGGLRIFILVWPDANHWLTRGADTPTSFANFDFVVTSSPDAAFNSIFQITSDSIRLI